MSMSDQRITTSPGALPPAFRAILDQMAAQFELDFRYQPEEAFQRQIQAIVTRAHSR